MVYNGKSRKKQPAMQNGNVDKGIFQFLGARIWVPMPVNQYEFPSGYVTGHYSLF